MRRRTILSILVAAVALPAQAAPPHYKVTLLAPLAHGQLTQVTGVNSAGQAVGWGNDNLTRRAVSWSSDGAVTAISPEYGEARGINDAGTIAGFTITAGVQYATLWSGGTMQQIASPNWETFDAISGNGHAAGGNIVGSDLHAIYYDGTMHDIGAFDGDHAGATGINNSDQVVGSSSRIEFGLTVMHAFYYSNGVMDDMGTLGGPESYAHGINNGGIAVGVAQAADWAGHAFSYDGGVMTDLGGLPGHSASDAVAINDLGQIVGDSEVGGDRRATLWQDGQIYDLNSLLNGSGVGWQLQDALGISSNGAIVGTGTYHGVRSNYLLQPAPAPEPTSWALMVVGFGAVGAALRNRRRLVVAA